MRRRCWWVSAEEEHGRISSYKGSLCLLRGDLKRGEPGRKETSKDTVAEDQVG